jgi:Arc/MetJ-type ribon-helix-helix transcriptional regulator
MSEFIVRLKGKQDEIIDHLVNEGYFNTKSEVIRAGILELYNKYFDNVTKEEVELVNKAIKAEVKKNRDNKLKTYTLDELEKEIM